MRIRLADQLRRHGMQSLRSSSYHVLASMFEVQPISSCTFFDRFMSSKSDVDCSKKDENKNYANEVTIPGLRYFTQVMSFGDGSNGALGHQSGGYLGDSFFPETVQGLPPNIMKVAAGHYHSLAVTEDGEVWAWGRNSEGQLGTRDENSRQEWDQPKRVKGLENVRVKDIAGSGVISMALAEDGTLWSWGSSKRGQLGICRDLIESKIPQQLVALADHKVCQIALGWGHALACTMNGELYAWGYGADGRLGFNPRSEHPKGKGHSKVEAHQRSEDQTRVEIAEVVEKQVHEMMAREKTDALVWKPRRVDALGHEKVTHVVCGMDHSLALTESGVLYSFGDNSLGQLGRPLGKDLIEAVKFPFEKEKVLSCAAGLGHSFAIVENPHDGSSIQMAPQSPSGLTKLLPNREKDVQEEGRALLFSWGWNSGSQLGRVGDPNLPGLVEGLGEERLVWLAAGRVHSMGLSSRRQVWIWGNGKNGRLGLDTPNDEPSPIVMETLGFWRTLQVACGFDHSLVLVRTLVQTPIKGTLHAT